MQPDATKIAEALAAAKVETTTEGVPGLGLVCRVAPGRARHAVRALKDSASRFTFMVDLFGIDTGEAVDVVYHLRSLTTDEEVYVKAAHAYGATIISVWDLFPAALTAERECAEMFGLLLAGHPNPKHLLVTEGTEPLLLKTTRIRTPEEVRER